MIERIRIDITPENIGDTEVKRLNIRIDSFGKPTAQKSQLVEPNELLSFYDQIWDCAKKELLRLLNNG